MKFPRNAKLLRSPFDVAPFAAVFFLLVIFLLLGVLLPTPGLQLNLPSADDSSLAGTDNPTVVVSIDANGRLFYANQIVTEPILSKDLKQAASASRQPLTMVVQADKSVPYGQIVHIGLLARDAGIYSSLLATQPRIVSAPSQP